MPLVPDGPPLGARQEGHTVDALIQAMFGPDGGQEALPLESALPAAGVDATTATSATSATSAQRIPVPRLRLRAALPIDVVTFHSACPSCGNESVWTEEREDTRMLLRIDCAHCPTKDGDQRGAQPSEQVRLGRRVGPAGRHGG